METELLVIGGGPAGLSAAIEAANAGVSVTIADESFTFGGQLRHQIQHISRLPQHYKDDRGFTLCSKLINKLNNLHVNWLPNHSFIGMYQDGRIGLNSGDDIISVQTKKLIIATGATEEPILFPGWTLPGVMTVGAVQILMNRERVIPGENALIVGMNNFSFETIQQLNDMDIKVKGVVIDDADLHANHEKINNMKDVNVPLFERSQLTRVSGRGKAEKAYFDQDGKETELDIDLVCMGGALSPILEPLEILDCDLDYEENLGGWLPTYNANFETSSQSVYVAGNAAGITDIGGILITGKIAGLSAAESLGAADTSYTKEKRQDLWNELYHLEKSLPSNVFDARLSVIRNFSLEFNKSFHSTF